MALARNIANASTCESFLAARDRCSSLAQPTVCSLHTAPLGDVADFGDVTDLKLVGVAACADTRRCDESDTICRKFQDSEERIEAFIAKCVAI